MESNLSARTARMLAKLANAPWPKPKNDPTQACNIVAGNVLASHGGYARVISKRAVGGGRVLPLYEICARPLEGDAYRQQLIVFRINALSYVNRVLWYREKQDLFGTPDVLHLVSCVSMKQKHADRAEDLYVSPWFRAAKFHVEKEPWGILSARHGFVCPHQVVQPYEETLRSKSSEQRRAWAARVLRAVPPARRYVIWAGSLYAEHLAPALTADLPLQGLGIGQQLAWFKARARESDNRS